MYTSRAIAASIGIVVALTSAHSVFAATSCVTLSRTLAVGSTGTDVTALQSFFNDVYDNFPSPTGYFGSITEAALKQWQQEHDLEPVGAVGPKTRAALSCGPAKTAGSNVSVAINVPSNFAPSPVSSTPAPSTSSTLSLGSTGDGVRTVQNFLISQNLLSPDAATGYFGPLTLKAVQLYQVLHSIVSSGDPQTTGFGAVGPRTLSSIQNDTTGAVVPTISSTTYVPPTVTNAACLAGGVFIPSGSSFTFFSQDSVRLGTACASVSQLRQCVNGVLTGDARFQYLACSVLAPSACSVNGIVIENGTSRTLYSQSNVAFGNSCTNVAQTRTCSNGNLDGSSSYIYGSCFAAGAASCSVGSASIPSGASQTFYSARQVAFGSSCSSVAQTRACNNGVVSGTSEYLNDTCAPLSTSSCTLDGATVTTGSSRNFYAADTVAYGTTCTVKSRKCTNGILDGDPSATHASCSVAAASSCVLDGATVASGSSRSFYTTGTVAYGTTCTAKSRTCSNGTLSGDTTATHASCTVNGPLSCTLDGATVASGSSATFYSSASAAYGGSCTSFAQNRTCTNGNFSGSSTYSHATCTVSAGASCTLDGATVASGASATFYNVATVPSGSSCSNFSQSRACTNGTLAGTNSYSRATCTTSSAPASQPTVTLVPIASDGLGSRDGKLLRYSITAGSGGSIGIGKFTFLISTNNVALASLGLYAFTDPGYSAPISGQGAGGLIGAVSSTPVGGNGTMQTYGGAQASSPIGISAGQTYYFELRATPSGTGSVNVSLIGDSSPQSGTFSAISSSFFAWSPNTNGVSVYTANDWQNGYGVSGLSSNGIGQSRTTAAAYDPFANLASAAEALSSALSALLARYGR